MLPINQHKFAETYEKARKLHTMGKLVEARAIYESLAKADPTRFEVHYQLAGLAWKEGDEAEALAHLRKARELKPDSETVLRSMPGLLMSQGMPEEALEICDLLVSKSPKDAGYRIDRAHKLQEMGRFDEAEAELTRAMKLDPRRVEPYRMICRGRKIPPGDPIIGKMRKLQKDPKISSTARAEIGFALAKAMEDTKQYDKVFRYLRPSNDAIKKASGYKVSKRQAEVDNLIESLRGVDFTPPPAEPGSFSPIFVTGLPRSGTTLVERILASHSKVTAGGEMGHVLRAVYKVIVSGNQFKPFTTLSPSDIEAIGKSYEHSARSTLPFDQYVTDKSIQSHLVMGIIRKAIPNARFVVVKRDPRDGLYSIYKNQFAKGKHGYAYNFDDLAAYYATFLKIIDFWREAMPGGFYEVRYEDLVADQEPQTRALIDAVGLEWEDACLKFHESKGAVKTLSVQQVRQPIYKSSAQAWRRYEKDLQPLIEALEKNGVVLDAAE